MFMLGQALGKSITLCDQVHRLLPDLKIPIAFNFLLGIYRRHLGVPSHYSLATTHYPLLTCLQLRLDGLGDFFEGDEALDFFDFLAVLGDEEAGGIAEKAAEFCGDIVVAEDDGIIHG